MPTPCSRNGYAPSVTECMRLRACQVLASRLDGTHVAERESRELQSTPCFTCQRGVVTVNQC